LGTYEFHDVVFEANYAARGSQLAVVGVQGATLCNEDQPPLALARAPNCRHPTSEIMTSMLLQSCQFVESVASTRASVSQRLLSNTRYSCNAPVSTACVVNQTRASGWQTERQANLPPAKRAGALYMQHATAVVHASAFGDEEAPPALTNLTCFMQHSACLSQVA
jgi:hypothetical protein